MTVEYIAFVNSGGQITSLQNYASESPEDGATSGSNTVRHITDGHMTGMNGPDHFAQRFIWKDSAWFDCGASPTDYYLFTDGAWAINTTFVTQTVRERRNSFLQITDWTQVADSPLTDAKKAEWVTYRQTLRDIMANLPADLDDPDDVVWPTAP